MMNKHSRVGRRLAGLGAVGAAGLAASTSQAAVVYTPLNVAIPANPNDFHVDLNNDGAVEFDIQALETVTKVIDVAPTTALVSDPDDMRTANLAAGTLIGPERLWGPLGKPPAGGDPLNGTIEEPPKGSGNFVPAGHFQVSDGPGYIGVQFDILGATHYGFVGYEGTGAENAPQGRVYAFGYETAAGTAIEAGAGAPPPIDADFDGDGDVDGQDFLRWQRNLGATGQVNNANGDADANGTVEGADLDAWKAQFSPGSPSVGSIPEPTSLSLLAAGAAGVMVYRRRWQ